MQIASGISFFFCTFRSLSRFVLGSLAYSSPWSKVLPLTFGLPPPHLGNSNMFDCSRFVVGSDLFK